MILIRIPEENSYLFEKYKEKYKKAYLYKNRIEINIYSYPLRIKPKDFPKNTQFLFECFECGGGMTNTGSAEIICGEEGEKIKPEKIYTTGHLSNRKHAKFLLDHPICITVSKSGICLLSERYFEDDGIYLSERTHMFWSGQMDDLPDIYSCFSDAIKAGYEKANKYHCRKPYYVIKTKENYEK